MATRPTKQFKMKEKEDASALTDPEKILIRDIRTCNHNKNKALDHLDALISTTEEVAQDPDSEDLTLFMTDQMTEAKQTNVIMKDEINKLFDKIHKEDIDDDLFEEFTEAVLEWRPLFCYHGAVLKGSYEGHTALLKSPLV